MPHTPDGNVDLEKARGATGSQMVGQMYALLKEIEWEGFAGDSCFPVCACCGNRKEMGHDKYCRLAAVLKAVEEEA